MLFIDLLHSTEDEETFVIPAVPSLTLQVQASNHATHASLENSTFGGLDSLEPTQPLGHGV